MHECGSLEKPLKRANLIVSFSFISIVQATSIAFEYVSLVPSVERWTRGRCEKALLHTFFFRTVFVGQEENWWNGYLLIEQKTKGQNLESEARRWVLVAEKDFASK